MIRPGMRTAGRTLALAAALTAALAAQGPYDKLLTIADVEKVTGLSGVKTVPNGSQTGAGGMLNFVNASGKLVLAVNFTFTVASLFTSSRTALIHAFLI